MGRLSELPTRFKVQIHAYVLMDNHYHLLIQPYPRSGSLAGKKVWRVAFEGAWGKIRRDELTNRLCLHPPDRQTPRDGRNAEK
ncbi:MAG: hypothetical protein OHK005_13690 [Candidatus Methylacidiphilales bacterium]